MERQFKEGMTAPDWEMDDYGWCAACPESGTMLPLIQQAYTAMLPALSDDHPEQVF